MRCSRVASSAETLESSATDRACGVAMAAMNRCHPCAQTGSWVSPKSEGWSRVMGVDQTEFSAHASCAKPLLLLSGAGYVSVSAFACLVSPYSVCCPCNLPARFNTNTTLLFRIRGTYARFKSFWLLRFETREFHSTDTIRNENQMKSKERREFYEIERRAALYACSTPHGSVHYRSCDGKRVNM